MSACSPSSTCFTRLGSGSSARSFNQEGWSSCARVPIPPSSVCMLPAIRHTDRRFLPVPPRVVALPILWKCNHFHSRCILFPLRFLLPNYLRPSRTSHRPFRPPCSQYSMGSHFTQAFARVTFFGRFLAREKHVGESQIRAMPPRVRCAGPCSDTWSL